MAPEDGLLKIIREALSLRTPAQSTELKQFMGRGEFCQRSQFGGVQPAVGVRRRHVDVSWRNNQESELGNIREGIDFVALADAQRPSPKQKKRHVGSKAGGNLK